MCEILPKNAYNFLVTTFKILQLLGDFVPRLTNGALPLNPAGRWGLPSPRPPVVLSPYPKPPSATFVMIRFEIAMNAGQDLTIKTIEYQLFHMQHNAG